MFVYTGGQALGTGHWSIISPEKAILYLRTLRVQQWQPTDKLWQLRTDNDIKDHFVR